VGGTLVVGTALLAATLRVPSGSTSFFVIGLLAAGTWIVGAFLSGPIRTGADRSSWQGEGFVALAVGIVAFLGFLAADLVGQHLPLIAPALRNILTKADAGPVALVLAVALVNGLGEELFFRGALFSALRSHHPVAGTVIFYVGVTAATGNVALVVAAGAMGIIFSLQRARSGGIFAPTVTHLCWSTLMLLVLPR
jgi:membrane protease YdiL (CAAX protease family)